MPDEAVGQTNGSILLRVYDLIDAERFEYAAVLLRERLDGEMGHVQFFQVEGSQGNDVHSLAEADDGGVDIFKTERFERLAVGGIGHYGIGGELGYVADGFGVSVDRDHLPACFIEAAYYVGTEVPETDYGEPFPVALPAVTRP